MFLEQQLHQLQQLQQQQNELPQQQQQTPTRQQQQQQQQLMFTPMPMQQQQQQELHDPQWQQQQGMSSMSGMPSVSGMSAMLNSSCMSMNLKTSEVMQFGHNQFINGLHEAATNAHTQKLRDHEIRLLDLQYETQKRLLDPQRYGEELQQLQPQAGTGTGTMLITSGNAFVANSLVWGRCD